MSRVQTHKDPAITGKHIAYAVGLIAILGGVATVLDTAITVREQVKANTRAIEDRKASDKEFRKDLRTVIGRVQLDVAAICVKVHDGDVSKCKTSGGR